MMEENAAVKALAALAQPSWLPAQPYTLTQCHVQAV
jgi:hypothetical protein